MCCMESLKEENEDGTEIGKDEEEFSISELKLLNLIAEIIVNVSIKEHHEKKSDSVSKIQSCRPK